jgi:phosphoribosylamine---glycine ligase
VRILLLGSGAREHAIALALAAEPEGHELLVAPGNAGIADVATLLPVDPQDAAGVAAAALGNAVDLVIVGPEAPLIAGVADAVRERGVPVFGPGREAARLEGSKAFAKRIMAAAGVPTGAATEAATLDEAERLLAGAGPYVVKADGLAAGKGVLVTPDRDAAVAHAAQWLEHGPVLVEQFLAGREVSLFFVSDGERVVPLTPAQDFKRLRDGDEGPNTGGMGAYSPLPWLADAFGSEQAFVERVQREVAEPVIAALAAESRPFLGLLYCGLVVDGTDVRVIEFNVRFGDPETQVVLARLASPLAPLLLAAARGGLDAVPAPTFADGAAVTVVLASEGYPESPAVGRPITGLVDAATVPGAVVEHAATTRTPDGEVLASGGRVLSVVGRGPTVADARAAAYEALGRIHLHGGQARSDIAAGVEG